MKRPDHYVDNREFLEHMVKYRKSVLEAEANDESPPQIPDEIGTIFWKIANHLSFKSNFISYGFRDDMIADGVENCIQYIHNFDPDKSKNPFSYFTQIIYYAFIRRIQKEKKQLYVKYKSLENDSIMQGGDTMSEEDYNNVTSLGFAKLYDNMSEFIHNYEDSVEKKKAIKTSKTPKSKKRKSGSNSNSILQFAANLTEEEKV